MTKKDIVKAEKGEFRVDPTSSRTANASSGRSQTPDEEVSSIQDADQGRDETFRSLVREAIGEIRQGNLFHTYNAIDLLDFGHEVVALGTVFLVIKLGWQNAITAPTNPKPLIFALLNFFNIMVYWINVMHGFKFSNFQLTLGQFWFFVSFGIGVTYYPIGLDAWIEGDRRELFYIVNIYMFFVLSGTYFIPPYKREEVNDLFLVYHRCNCPLGLVWYTFIFILDELGWPPAQWTAFAPLLLFVVPLGARRIHREEPIVESSDIEGSGVIDMNNENDDNGTARKSTVAMQKRRQSRIQVAAHDTRKLLIGAYHDLQTPGQRLSPFDGARFKNFFNSVTSLAVTFLVFAFSWEYAYNADDDPKPLLLSIYAYFHVVVYWLGIRHSMAFSPDEFSISQVWLVTGMILMLTYYPISLQLWLEKDDTTLYFIVSLALCCLIAVFNYITPIDKSQANALFILFQAYGGGAAVMWYGVAFMLTELGFSQGEWMIYVAPFLYMLPLGASRTRPPSSSPDERTTVEEKVDIEDEVQQLAYQLNLRDAIVEDLEDKNRGLQMQNSNLLAKISQLESQNARLRQRRWSR